MVDRFMRAVFWVVVLIGGLFAVVQVEASPVWERSRRSAPSTRPVSSKTVEAGSFAASEGFRLDVDVHSGLVSFDRDDMQIRALVGDDEALIRDQLVDLGASVVLRDSRAYLPTRFVSAYRRSVRSRDKERSKVQNKERSVSSSFQGIQTIILDPGHGGRNFGAVGPFGAKEKDVVLDIAKHLQKMLENAGKKVLLTRNKDHFVTLQDRARIANQDPSDFFISIHANAARNRAAHGVETFFLSNKTDDYSRALVSMENQSFELDDDEKRKLLFEGGGTEQIVKELKYAEIRRKSVDMAHAIQKELAKAASSKDRGVKSANFYVLRKVDSPSVLVEVGFLTNPSEEKRLKTKKYRMHIAKAIYHGIMTYDKDFRQSDGFTR